MDVINFIKDGSVIFKEIESPINGLLTVKWDITFGYQIMGGGLWQVGGPVRMVWKVALDKIKAEEIPIKKVLILGLGGGSIAKLIRELWGDVKLVGIDVDPVIVDLGKEYLGLNNLNVDIHIADAYSLMTKNNKREKYDLICIDTYVGDSFPKKFESEAFLKSVSKQLSTTGVAVFNRLYYGDKRQIADKFEVTLKNNFNQVDPVYPEVSALYICRN